MQNKNEKNNPVRNDGSQSEPVSNGTRKSDAALPVSAGSSDSAKREETVLKFWKENNIFEKSLELTRGGKEFIFYEGPPTANGKPGIHHLEARAFKDVIPRYKTMRGFHVRRKGGWDTHGLPVELQVEKKLGLNSKKAIEEYGIAKFNQECKESVWEYLDVWNKFTERIGFWVDQKNPYVTYENNYIESLWNVVKKINERGLLYKDYKVVPWCPRCGTALSSHELAQGYEDVKDLSVYVKFRVLGGNTTLTGSLSPRARGSTSPSTSSGQENMSTYFLAWTTTPWTLPGNVALAVGKDIDYVKVKFKNEILILAKARLSILAEPYEIIEELKGKDLVGIEYEPLFPYLSKKIEQSEKPKLEKAHKVYDADFVTTEDGTGIVHTAVMYGQDDFVLGTKIGLPKHHLVNLEGRFIKGTGFLEGRFVKEKDENGKPTLDVDIIKYLTDKNLFFAKENYQHSYPHCWRCHTALIYYARDSWYIKVSDPKIKDQLISENKKINWEPEHIKEGRFGEWIREIKDWAISRERYWGTPLPVWVCESCKKIDVVGSISDLQKKAKKSGNKYFVMRHGEAENNALKILSYNDKFQHHLTERGRNEVKNSAMGVRNVEFDFIFSSPILRAQETAEILKSELKINLPIITDGRLSEFDSGEFDGKPAAEYNRLFKDKIEFFTVRQQGIESLNDIKKRVGGFLAELEAKYKDKNILIISHGDPIWMMCAAGGGMKPEEAVEFSKENFFTTGEIRKLDFSPLPRNENYELDLHKPYIDEMKLMCQCGGNLFRIREVMDVWFDSGAMPFAQDHYPFENKSWVEGKGYPADYISEAVDQTRGWFYTLHAVGALMGFGHAYKNVICLGHLLDAKGKKMSKSLGNVIDPWIMMEKYGVDTLRMWMYSVNQPGESKNFDEKTVLLLHQQIFGLLYNVLAFYELYRDKKIETNDRPKSKNILDKWILARLDELIGECTLKLDDYKLLEPVRGIRDFINDLSTWYLQCSRECIKEDDPEAKQTLYFVLKNLAKLLAPFAPFAAEDIWQKLKNDSDPVSVHLSKWPSQKIFSFGNSKVRENMKTVREIVSRGLEERQKAGIKVKNVEHAELGGNEICKLILDTVITSELKEEGDLRELLRALQEMRKKAGLTPSDMVNLAIETDSAGRQFAEKFENEIKKTVLVSRIEFKENGGSLIKIDDLIFKVKIETRPTERSFGREKDE